MVEMLEIIDTHAHLEEIQDLAGTIAAAKKANIVAVIAVGSDLKSNQRILEIARSNPGYAFPALGLHPWNMNTADIDADCAFIEAHRRQIIAIGEIGLDYHKKVLELASKDTQKQYFSELLKIAGKNNKVALIHSRYSWKDCLDIVIKSGVEKAVFHWYTGPSSVLRDILSNGYFISVTPAVEYHAEHRRAVRETPLDRLLLETDSPVTYGRGREGEFQASPADAVRSLNEAAKLKEISVADLAVQTTNNAVKLFELPLL
jgi:TatD DNase family protein